MSFSSVIGVCGDGRPYPDGRIVQPFVFYIPGTIDCIAPYDPALRFTGYMAVSI